MPGQLSGRRPDHRVRWRAGVGHRPLAVRRLRRSWAMQRTVPAELASTSPVRQLCPTGVGGTAPCCRGQALPDPPARRAGHHAIAGRRCAKSTHGAPDHTRAIARKDASPSGAGVDCRASRPAGEAAPRPYKTGQCIAGRALRHHGGAVSRSIGGWRCLTHWPARAGRDTRGLSASVTERSPPARVCRAFPAPVARRARRRLAPTGIGRRVRRSGSRAPRVGATSPAW